jgi:drug/metabolite transporter (DMT)-like permease
MNRLRLVIASGTFVLWTTMYLAAAFVDPTLAPLAQSVTPVMLGVVGFVFGQEGIKAWKGKGDE